MNSSPDSLAYCRPLHLSIKGFQGKTTGSLLLVPAWSYLSSSEYILAYSSLTSSRLLAFPSSRLKDPISEVRARVIERKSRPFGSLLPDWFREPMEWAWKTLTLPGFHFPGKAQVKCWSTSSLVSEAQVKCLQPCPVKELIKPTQPWDPCPCFRATGSLGQGPVMAQAQCPIHCVFLT